MSAEFPKSETLLSYGGGSSNIRARNSSIGMLVAQRTCRSMKEACGRTSIKGSSVSAL
jgi:hypothetical protein